MRTRWALLVVFWLGWLGMLVGAVLIILQAPRCRDLPVTSWWNDGPLYQIGNIRAFTDAQNLKGENTMNIVLISVFTGQMMGRPYSVKVLVCRQEPELVLHQNNCVRVMLLTTRLVTFGRSETHFELCSKGTEAEVLLDLALN